MILHNNMEFEMKSCFIPNISNSHTLRILEISQGSVVVQMQDSNCRGVFPAENFHYWIKRGSLLHITDDVKKTS